jgi:hypothetical protein
MSESLEKSSSNNHHRADLYLGLWIAITLGVIIRLWVAWQPIPVLIEKNLPDDAYYYFSIARNSIESGSVSIDGIHTTNGFHPLWWLLLLLIFRLPTTSPDFPVHLALTLAAMLDGLAIAGIWLITFRLTKSKEASFFAGICYAINPVVVLQATNGLETGLTQFCLIWFWWLLVGWMDEPNDMRRMFLTGVMGGFMLLARNDTLFFYTIGIFAWILLTGFRRGWKFAVGAFSITILMNIPWYLVSRWLLNSWVQDSGLAVPYAIQQRWLLNNGAEWLPRLEEGLRQIFLSYSWLRGDPTGLPLFIGIGLWVFVLTLLIIHWLRSRDKRSMAFLLPPIIAGAMLMLFHGGLRWYPRPWYFLVLSAAFPVAAAFTISVQQHPWQKDFLRTSYWINENIPKGTLVGSFNAGIYSYYSGRTIVNLDGVVNHEAFLALKKKQIMPFLREKKVEYLVDSTMALTDEYGPFLGGDLTTESDEIIVIGEENSWAIGPIHVYRIRPVQ